MVLYLAVLPAGCDPDNSQQSEPPAGHALPAAVPGIETAVATTAMVRDSVSAVGAVTATAEPPEARDARTQLAEGESRLRLAEQQVRRLEALAQGAVAPQKELEAAKAEHQSAQLAVDHARQVLAAFGTTAVRTPLAADETWVIAQVVQRDMGRVAAGQAAVFTADAFRGHPLSGVVDAEPPYVDPATRMAPLRLRVRDVSRELRPGMTGHASITCGEPRAAVVVPDAAVIYDGAQPIVLVRGDHEHYAPRPVRLGVTDDGRVEIAAGLEAGATVATTGAASLLSALRLGAGGDEE